MISDNTITQKIDLPSVEMASLDQVVPVPNREQSIYNLNGPNHIKKTSVIISPN